jgi:hypothetical protein
VKQLQVSNELLGDARQLRKLLDTEGYVFFRDVIDHKLVQHVKHGVMAWFASEGLVEVVDDEPIWTGADVGAIGLYPDGLVDTNLCEWFALQPSVRAFYEQVFGEPAHVLPMGEYQFPWPGKPDTWSIVHQDGPYNPGLDFFVVWVPLMSIDEPLGGLAIVPTPQSRGSLQTSPEPNAHHLPFIPRDTFPEEAWHRIDYQPGDVLIFGAWTPHCGMPNTTDLIRLSIDIRVQPTSSPRPILGVVIVDEPDRVVIGTDGGEELPLAVDGHTSMPYIERNLLGRRVLATADAGRALLIRNQRGHLPWDQ